MWSGLRSEYLAPLAGARQAHHERDPLPFRHDVETERAGVVGASVPGLLRRLEREIEHLGLVEPQDEARDPRLE
ncbi:MAG TPA: hypothetical protein VNI57_05115, partial [Candidatus Saccharimonadales bacterium]|nr:hypothetical protein [Candidatus Saccharimonadales bacterium]